MSSYRFPAQPGQQQLPQQQRRRSLSRSSSRVYRGPPADQPRRPTSPKKPVPFAGGPSVPLVPSVPSVSSVRQQPSQDKRKLLLELLPEDGKSVNVGTSDFKRRFLVRTSSSA